MPTLLATSPLAGHAVEAGDDGVGGAAAQQAGRRRVDEQGVLDAEPAELPDGQPRALQERARLAGEHLHRAGGRPARRSRPGRFPRPDAASAPELQWVISVTGPGGRTSSSASAPWRASASLAASSSRWIASAVRARCGGHVVGRRERGGEHALDRPAEVARGRPCAGAAPRRRAPARRRSASARPPWRARTPRRCRSAAHRARPDGGSPPRCRPRRTASARPPRAGSRVWSSTCSTVPSQRSGGGVSVLAVSAIGHDARR